MEQLQFNDTATTTDAMLQFEKEMETVKHKYCPSCQRVSINLQMDKKNQYCTNCSKNQHYRQAIQQRLPVWHDENGNCHYEQPEELKNLREAEKLLIAQYAAYIPLEHLKKGQFGCNGHVCCFPQDISNLCTVLPRLPSQIDYVKMVKHYKTDTEVEGTKTFVVRRKHVLDALRWLKKYNIVYAEVQIEERNLDWMEGKAEVELPTTNR